MTCLLEEEQQVVRSQPHRGGVSHGVEEEQLVASLHQIPVQNELHTVVCVEEQGKSRGTSLLHLRRGGKRVQEM